MLFLLFMRESISKFKSMVANLCNPAPLSNTPTLPLSSKDKRTSSDMRSLNVSEFLGTINSTFQLSQKYLKVFEIWESESEVVQSCPALCDPMDWSLSGSSLHGIFQARVLEWVAISFSRRSSQPRDRTQVSRIVGKRFTV